MNDKLEWLRTTAVDIWNTLVESVQEHPQIWLIGAICSILSNFF